jgi:hypothetical protein
MSHYCQTASCIPNFSSLYFIRLHYTSSIPIFQFSLVWSLLSLLNSSSSLFKKLEEEYSVLFEEENYLAPKGCHPHAIVQNMNYCGPISISAYGNTNRISASFQHRHHPQPRPCRHHYFSNPTVIFLRILSDLRFLHRFFFFFFFVILDSKRYAVSVVFYFFFIFLRCFQCSFI